MNTDFSILSFKELETVLKLTFHKFLFKFFQLIQLTNHKQNKGYSMAKMYKILAVVMLLITSSLFAQNYTVSGTVTDAITGDNLTGANVVVKGTYVGAASDVNGKYSFTVNEGNVTIVCSYIGYETKEVTLDVQKNTEVNFSLKDKQFSLNVTVLADRAKEQETPVAFTNVDKKDMELKLGSQDIPMVLNTTPSVYATMQGGGAGDARINVRGFNQRNMAIMINGVPVNDMENGWVYWSNWDGLGDASSSIQVQRGLTAVNLATPSIGGTMNIITDPTAQDMGFSLKQEFGSGSFMKTSLFGHTGLINDKYAVTVGVVRKTGDGVVDKTWTDAWAYYVGAAYNYDENNRFELYAVGAPQRHGQNLYKQNAAAYDSTWAMDKLGYTSAQVQYFAQSSAGRRYNENWGPVSSSYKGLQSWNGSTHDRYAEDFINERENYFHKPQVNLNWYSNLSNQLSVYTTAYYSGGNGGGSGTYGSLKWNYNVGIPSPSRFVAFDATIANNQTTFDSTHGYQSKGILRNSVNNQYTWGILSKAIYKLNDNVKTVFGVDARLAEIEHYQEVRDLLGGDFFARSTENDFWNGETQYLTLGDKFNYYNTNNVQWLGAYGSAEYSSPLFTAYGTLAWSTISYKYTNHFRNDGTGNEFTLESDNFNGFQVKGGASYRFSTEMSTYANFGYVEKVPIFDAVIDDIQGVFTDNPKNERFTSFELGANYEAETFSAKLSAYYTQWNDRAYSKFVQTDTSGNGALIFLTGMNALHTGVELELAYQPMSLFRLDGAASLGNWTYTDDVSGTYKNYDNPTDPVVNYDFYVKGLKVGDAPQTQLALQASVFPMPGMTAQVVYRYNARLYADFDPFSRTDSTDTAQSWETPAYSLVDFHFRYILPWKFAGVRMDVFAHVFNVFDEIYISDAVDESHYNAISTTVSGVEKHSAQRAEVFLGPERYINFGFGIKL